jgi:hypothetical protein
MIFLLQLYGRESSVVHKWSLVSHWSLKFGLAALVAGSLFNALTFASPSFAQVLSNLGLAAIFSWAVMFHHKIFSSHDKEE